MDTARANGKAGGLGQSPQSLGKARGLGQSLAIPAAKAEAKAASHHMVQGSARGLGLSPDFADLSTNLGLAT